MALRCKSLILIYRIFVIGMMITGEKPAVAVKVAVSVVIALVAVVAVALFVNVQIVDEVNEPECVRKNKNLQLVKPKCFRKTVRRSFQHVHRNLSEDTKEGISHNAILADSRKSLAAPITDAMTPDERGEIASEKNQLMDELLDLSQIPSDYGATMIALFRDRSQDVVTRDFAVQHIGLYAQALARQGTYDPDSSDAADCRSALFDAALETQTIVAAAAFRALAGMAEFDSRVDTRRLDGALISCVGDRSASCAARVMAAQICGERKLRSSKSVLELILCDASAPDILRRAASWSLETIRVR